MPFDLTIDPDITTATTLPGRLYGDEQFFQFCRQHMLTRSWQIVADADVVRTPQAVHPCTFLEGCIDEPLLLTRDDNDQLHCFSNVCTHRGALVAPTPCRTTHLRCPYHGRRFALDGTYQSMPEFEDTKYFPTSADNLPGVPHELFGPLIFAAIDPLFSFDELIAPVRDRIGWLPLDEFIFDPNRSRDYLVKANWALYCDNYLEGFHVPFVHAGLATQLDYGAYRTELFTYSNVQVGVSRGGESTFDLPSDSPDAGQSIAGYFFWLFLNIMLNFYPWGMSVNIVRPLSVNRTKVSFRSYVWDASQLDVGAGAELDRVEREDETIVEQVQTGVAGRLYDRGRYSPTREQGVHHFHQLLARFCQQT